MKLARHPQCGRILVARHDLPKGYRLVYHGVRRSVRDLHSVDAEEDRTIWFYPDEKVNGFLDPAGIYGCVMQFAACTGPGELANLKQSGRTYGGRGCKYGGVEYITKMPVPKGSQLVHWYGWQTLVGWPWC